MHVAVNIDVTMWPSTAVLVTCVILYQSFCVSSNKISISNHCLGNQHCQSLESASKQSINNTVLMIIDTQYTLLEVAKFVRAGNVTITGKGKYNTQLICADNVTNITGAGIIFENSSNISLRDLTITECGLNITDSMANRKLTGTTTAVLINRCSQVTISSIIVSNSGQGLTLVNTLSQVNVTDSQFINNIIVNKEDWPGGGGLQILFNSAEEFTSYFFIVKNLFAYNSAISANVFPSIVAGRGGGVRILFLDGCRNTHILVNGNHFENNNAVYGGGLMVLLSGNALLNTINISNNIFVNNSARAGGGGAAFGYSIHQQGIYLHDRLYPKHNTLTVFNSTFENNKAVFGGGIYSFTSAIGLSFKHPFNEFVCDKCHFENNIANNGAALDATINPDELAGGQYILEITLVSCFFIKNKALDSNSESVYVSNGAVHVLSVPLRFNKTTTFIGNTGSALYIASASVKFSEYSYVVYQSNSGYKGGAIYMFGESEIRIFDNSSFYFQNNSAALYGGAICAEISQPHFFSLVDSCFIRVSLSDNNNITFHFKDNNAVIGNDIFTTTIAPCAAICQHHSGIYYNIMTNLSNFFKESCLGTFNFSDQNETITTRVATSPQSITADSPFVDAIPGIKTELNITQTDEFEGDVSQFFPLSASIANSDKCAKIHSDYLVVTGNNLIIIGNPGAQGKLLLQNQSVKKILDFQLHDCPPGFILDVPGCDAQCICFELLRNISLSYNNLQCLSDSSSMAIYVGYWAGYANTSKTSQDTLYTGNCIVELLTHNIEDDNVLHKLPRDPSELETKICDKNRKGLLCGRCNENTSVYYHSNRYTCGTNEYCRYGILIYIVSELLPVTSDFQ